jgi:hypothetical protein
MQVGDYTFIIRMNKPGMTYINTAMAFTYVFFISCAVVPLVFQYADYECNVLGRREALVANY